MVDKLIFWYLFEIRFLGKVGSDNFLIEKNPKFLFTSEKMPMAGGGRVELDPF